MFDEVVIDKLHCYRCGYPIVNRKWQTKDGECALAVFDSFEGLCDANPEVPAFALVNNCPQCSSYLVVELSNVSDKYKEWLLEHVKQMKLNWTKDALLAHPNHDERPSQVVWCPKCKKADDG